MIIQGKPKKYAETVGEIVQNRHFLTFHPDDKIPEMIERMSDAEIAAGVVVSSSGRCVGIVTEREIVRRAFGNTQKMQVRLDYLSDNKQVDEKTAWDIMIASPDRLHPEDSIEDALDVISYFGYRHMPVVTHQGTALGIIDALELHEHVQERSKEIQDCKDSLLSYFMGLESYGRGASI